MKTSAIVPLVFAASLAAPAVAAAQTAEPAPYHRYYVHHVQGPHHYVHNRNVAPPPVATPAPAASAAPQSAPFGLALPHIAPYPDNKGDEDGLSGDTNDCNKGCVDGAPD